MENEQYLVEEVYDRELRQAEEYQRKKGEEMRDLFGGRQSISSYGATDNESDDSEGSSYKKYKAYNLPLSHS